MNIHEYQAKEILKRYGVNIPAGYVADTVDKAYEKAKQLKQETGVGRFVIKAQIHAGGRGKGGGVKVAHSLDQVKDITEKILGMQLVTHQTGPEGKKVHKVLVTEDIFFNAPTDERTEFYISVLVDRARNCNVIMASTEGGTEIEEVAAETPEKIIKEWVDPGLGLKAFQARKIAYQMGLTEDAAKEMTKFLIGLYKAFIETDASLIEINPAVKTWDNRVLAVDAKITIDDNALFRHPDLTELRDINEEDPLEVEAGKLGLSYVKLDGNVGCMVNGAGLAMATMDIIKLSGGKPANFLDVGGGANAKTVEAGFRIIMKDPNVQAILINVFGGILRCDRVANGVVEAYKNIGSIDIPIIVRLQGTNAEEGAKIIEESGLKVSSAILLKDAVERVKEVLT
jgi:succinyl-CoA synthetase beta subunit